jgi:diazepam-binding inhibitor (GABA receptor modulating acyl-CoA-binding protein)
MSIITIDINRDFNRAVHYVNSYNKPIQPDILLRLYAYYRMAHEDTSHSTKREEPIIKAFKLNALLQVLHMDSVEAKKNYVELVSEAFDFSIS